MLNTDIFKTHKMRVFCKFYSIQTLFQTQNRFISLTSSCCNHYNVLGVSHKASDKEIKKAYLEKCQKYHPDKHPDDESVHEKFVKVNEAYQVCFHLFLCNKQFFQTRKKNLNGCFLE